MGDPASRLLPLWFLGWTLFRLRALSWTGQGWDLTFFGRDFWIYRNASTAVLTGGDPWSASYAWNGTDWHFAGPPIAAQLLVPFAMVGEAVALPLFLAIAVGSAWLALRHLGLPAWWLLFPPMSEGIFAANPQVLLFGLVVLGGSRAAHLRMSPRSGWGWPIARAVAVGLKVYAIAPVIARKEWRAIAALLAIFVISVALGAGLWGRYLNEFDSISRRLMSESEGGLSAALWLRPGVFGRLVPESVAPIAGILLYVLIAVQVVIAAMRDVEGAGWLAAPLLSPAAEYHLATMAIPAARSLATWIIAIPTVPTYLLGLIVLAYQVTAGHRPIVPGQPRLTLLTWLRTPSGRVERSRPVAGGL